MFNHMKITNMNNSSEADVGSEWYGRKKLVKWGSQRLVLRFCN